MFEFMMGKHALAVSVVALLVGCALAGIGTLMGGGDSIALPGFLQAVFG